MRIALVPTCSEFVTIHIACDYQLSYSPKGNFLLFTRLKVGRYLSVSVGTNY